MNILEKIAAGKRQEVAERERRTPLGRLVRRADRVDPPRDLVAALRASNDVALIAEVKKASPSAGIIREDFDAVAIATVYQEHGAGAISCLTDETHFQGSFAYLTAIRETVRLPVMCKDFLLTEYQVVEARAAGADAVLLIAELLDDAELRGLLAATHDLGMRALVELYEEGNLARVLDAGAQLIGINNRDLRTFRTDIEHTIRLAPSLAPDRMLVSESGIRSRRDVQRLREAGARAILVGETLMRADDIGAKVDELLGR